MEIPFMSFLKAPDFKARFRAEINFRVALYSRVTRLIC